MQSTSFLKPRIIDVQAVAPYHAKVVMEPFERGYGHTLGNALRRTLLSSMPGYAATEVRMAGVLHEYSTIDGVQEDVVDVILNLKGVVMKLHNRSEATLKLKKAAPGAVTGPGPFLDKRSSTESRVCISIAMALRFSSTSTTSSWTPSMLVYSWSTPSISTSVTAQPGIEESSTRRSALPSVWP